MGARKHPLVAGGWARRCDDCHPDEALVHLISVRDLPGGYQMWTVRAPGATPIKLLAGYLESVPSVYAP